MREQEVEARVRTGESEWALRRDRRALSALSVLSGDHPGTVHGAAPRRVRQGLELFGAALLASCLVGLLGGAGCVVGGGEKQPAEPALDGLAALAAAAPVPAQVVEPPHAARPVAFDDPVRVVVPPGAPRDWRDEIIYFVMTDRFFDGDPHNNADTDRKAQGAFHGGDFVGLTRKLGYLSQLGVTALWITPVVKQIDHPVHGAGFPDWGYHGYWAEDFTRVEPRLGSEEELRRLVDTAHGLGIKVLIDVVLNHPGYGSHFVKDPSMVRTIESGTCKEDEADDLLKCLAGLPDFRTEDPKVADLLMEWQTSWIERTRCDGFRIDTAKHVDHAVWREFRKRIKEVYPDFFLLGEVWGATMHEEYASEYLGDQMDSLFDFGFHGAVEGFVQGRGRPAAFGHYLQTRHRFADRMVLAHYLDTHDVPTLLSLLAGDRKKMTLAAVLQLTSLGIPVITWGNEVGRLGGEWPANRSDMLWGEAQDGPLLLTYRRLIQIRRAHKALSRGGYQTLHAGEDTLVYLRSWPEGPDQVIVAVNRGGKDEMVPLVLTGAAGSVSAWHDALAADDQRMSPVQGKLLLTIPAGRAMILEAAAK